MFRCVSRLRRVSEGVPQIIRNGIDVLFVLDILVNFRTA
jgi:hypothetical protein